MKLRIGRLFCLMCVPSCFLGFLAVFLIAFHILVDATTESQKSLFEEFVFEIGFRLI